MEEALVLALPEDCVAACLFLTSPSDVCRWSLVSTTFRSACESDVVWERFLPSDYQTILSQSTTPLKYSSKKDLFLCLSNSLLIDGGKKSFKLDKSSGKISYTLSARDLSITWSSEPMYWSWVAMPESRFAEVAVIIRMSWLEIKAKISTRKLSPNTKYGAYLIFKISDRGYGLNLIPSEISIQVGNDQVHRNTVYLQRIQDGKKQQMEHLLYGNRIQMLKSRVCEGEGRVPSERNDGWLEIELGEFFCGDDDKEVEMSLMEVKGHHFKGGLIVEGIEIRPKHY
ncbi:SKP1 interacting partner 3-related family protein [Tripterygium wilfordii]|uniref:SKP1 interacting partner 3-related family protein n=1 Tax=Tripterygium wilfordii TaxID=458696 RepID=A0A7J7CUF6_TRIWF|nr:F-box protein PP2-B15-like [Tripterygium wilfordii]KAF5737755.1 SKP1 interacting partner 3-related family protein [Tripterygium wilfordii]